jgi:hypothetical protein
MTSKYWDVDGELHSMRLIGEHYGDPFIIEKELEGQITFRDGCDEIYTVTMSKEDAKKALLEAIAWIDKS